MKNEDFRLNEFEKSKLNEACSKLCHEYNVQDKVLETIIAVECAERIKKGRNLEAFLGLEYSDLLKLFNGFQLLYLNRDNFKEFHRFIPLYYATVDDIKRMLKSDKTHYICNCLNLDYSTTSEIDQFFNSPSFFEYGSTIKKPENGTLQEQIEYYTSLKGQVKYDRDYNSRQSALAKGLIKEIDSKIEKLEIQFMNERHARLNSEHEVVSGEKKIEDTSEERFAERVIHDIANSHFGDAKINPESLPVGNMYNIFNAPVYFQSNNGIDKSIDSSTIYLSVGDNNEIELVSNIAGENKTYSFKLKYFYQIYLREGDILSIIHKEVEPQLYKYANSLIDEAGIKLKEIEKKYPNEKYALSSMENCEEKIRKLENKREMDYYDRALLTSLYDAKECFYRIEKATELKREGLEQEVMHAFKDFRKDTFKHVKEEYDKLSPFKKAMRVIKGEALKGIVR